jgi:hypothetical protein
MEKSNITMAGFNLTSKPVLTKAPDYKNLYSNVVRSGVTPWDIRITFGQLVESPDNVPGAEDQITVIMSPAQAKAVLGNLQTSIQGYESLFGEIKDLTPIIEKAKAEPPAIKEQN